MHSTKGKNQKIKIGLNRSLPFLFRFFDRFEILLLKHKQFSVFLFHHLRICFLFPLGLWALLWATADASPSFQGRQQVTFQEPFDHSWITEWAAIGDSFASRVGSGKRISWWCSRYDNAYGSLINSDMSLGDNPNRKFHNLGCLGHTITDILSKQVKSLTNGQSMITLSAGGNDVGFADLVDACIYQYDKRNWECDGQLRKTREAIESDAFRNNLDKLIQATVKKLRYSNSRVFWTGYAKFFDTTLYGVLNVA